MAIDLHQARLAAIRAETAADRAVAEYDALVFGAVGRAMNAEAFAAAATSLATAAADALDAALEANARLGKTLQWYRDDAAYFRRVA